MPGGIVQTESVLFSGDPTVHHRTTTQVPVVATEARKVHLESDDGNYEATGEIVSSQTISSKTRTVETITVSTFYCYSCMFETAKNCSTRPREMELWRHVWSRR